MKRETLIYLVKVVATTVFIVLVALLYFLLKPFFTSSDNISDLYLQKNEKNELFLCILESSKLKEKKDGQLYELESFRLNQINTSTGQTTFSKILGNGQFIYHTSKTLWFMGTDEGIKGVNALHGEMVTNSRYLNAKNPEFNNWQLFYIEGDTLSLQTMKGEIFSYHENEFSFYKSQQNNLYLDPITSVDSTISLVFTENNNASVRYANTIGTDLFLKPLLLRHDFYKHTISIDGNVFLIHQNKDGFYLSAVKEGKKSWSLELDDLYASGMNLNVVTAQNQMYLLAWNSDRKNLIAVDTKSGKISWKKSL